MMLIVVESMAANMEMMIVLSFVEKSLELNVSGVWMIDESLVIFLRGT
jgi:hypothetical protein